MLKTVEIKGYRSIENLKLELRPLNVLIGANGAGKSNFVSFFKLLNEMMGNRLQQYIATTGRGQSILHFGPKSTPQMEGSMEFQKGDDVNLYCMKLGYAPPGDTLFFTEETLDFRREGSSAKKPVSLGAGHQETRIGEAANNDNKTAKVFRYLLNQCRVYHFHDTSPTAKPRLASYVNNNRWLMPDAGNLAAILFAYKHKSPIVYGRIISAIKKIMPEFEDFELEPSRLAQTDIFLNWRKQGSDYLFGPHQISDGSLRAMAICSLFLQPEEDLPNVIILDEPELGLHPRALEIVAGLVRAASTRTQVIVATQSQSFLDYFDPSEVITVETHEGRSVFRRLESEQLIDWLEDYSIGELWSRNVLGGGPLP